MIKKLYFKGIVGLLTGNKSMMLGTVLVGFVLLSALLADLLAPYPPNSVDMNIRLAAPSWQHLLGTDQFGRDLLSRILCGLRTSLILSLMVLGLTIIVGTLLGIIAGYSGGTIDTIAMRIIDIWMSIPGILTAILIVAILGPGMLNVTIAIAAWNTPIFARLARVRVLSVKEEYYVKVAKALGFSEFKIILRHVLPNIVSEIVVLGTLQLPGTILSISALSFLGLGVEPPTPELGAIVSDGRGYIHSAWWISTLPGFAILFSVLGFNLFGDGLRDYLDPRLRRSI